MALIELISPAAPPENWLQLKSFPCRRKNIGHFLPAAERLLRAISNFLSVSLRSSEEEEEEDGASARDYSYLDDGPAVPPGWWLGGGGGGWGGLELKLHSISANTETLRVAKRGR